MRARLSIAGVATLLFLAGPARATIYQFQIVSDASSLTTVVFLTASSQWAKFDDVVHSYGEPNPSNAAKALGSFSADITPGASIAFQTGASITFPSAYAYLPSTVPAQLGFEISLGASVSGPFSNGGYGYAYASGITMAFGDGSCALNGGGALAYLGGNSYAGGNNTLCGAGTVFEFSSSALGTGGAYGFSLPFGFSSPNTVNFDGTTIVIPVNSTTDFLSGGNVLRYVTSGSLVAQVVAIPEPSSLLLVGGGTLGLAGLRARRRR